MPKERSTLAKARDALETVADAVSLSKGHVVARRSFYYGNGQTSEAFAKRVLAALAKANVELKVLEHGRKDAPFKGGQSVAKGSHWWVRLG